MRELSALKAIADAATDGPWRTSGSIGRDVLGPQKPSGASSVVGYGVWPENAAYIATFDPPTVSKLLAVVEAAEEIVSPAYDDGTQPGPYCEGVRLDEMRNLMAALAALHDTEGR